VFLLVSRSLEFKLLGGFPGEAVTPEVAVGGGLLVDGVLQLKIFDNLARAEVEVLLNNLQKLLLALRRRSVAEDGDGKGLGDTNGVGNLDQDALAESSLNERLSHPASGVSGGAVHLGEILAGESATTMSTPAAVSVDDDFTSRQSGVTHGSTDDELAGRLQVEDGVVVHVLGGDDFLDHAGHENLSHGLELNVLVVLHGDDDRVHTLGDASAILERVLARDLGLGVGSEPLAGSVTPEVSHSLVKLVSEDDGERHSFLSLVRGVAEHQTLITGTSLILITTNVDTLGNVGRLLFESDKDVAGLVVESLRGVIIADVLDRVTDDLLVVDDSLGSDFTADEDHASLGNRFAGNFGVGILLEMGVQDGVGHLITDLVRVTFSDRLGSEEERLDVLLSNFVAAVEIRHFSLI